MERDQESWGYGSTATGLSRLVCMGDGVNSEVVEYGDRVVGDLSWVFSVMIFLSFPGD